MNYFVSICKLFVLSVLLVGCVATEERAERDAEKIAQAFSIAWQNEDYASVYDYFIPDLQTMKSKEDFVAFVKASQAKGKFSLIYDKVVLQDKETAYAYYTFSGESVFQPKSPAVQMKLVSGQWKINGFAPYFTKTCLIDDCAAHTGNTLFESCLVHGFSLTVCQEVLKQANGQAYVCDRSTDFTCKMINASVEEVKAPPKLLSEEQINSALALGKASAANPSSILSKNRIEAPSGVIGQGMSFLTPQTRLAWEASQKELTPEEVNAIASADEIWFIADTYGNSIDFNIAVNAVITFDNGSMLYPIRKEGSVSPSAFWPESPAYWAPMVFAFPYSAVKGKQFTFAVTNQASYSLDFSGAGGVTTKRMPTIVTCESLGCAPGTVAVAMKTRFEYYPCECRNVEGLRNTPATDLICFATYSETAKQGYAEAKSC
jgi:hypothetical protein